MLRRVLVVIGAAFAAAACGGSGDPGTASTATAAAQSNSDFEYVVTPLRVQANPEDVAANVTRCHKGTFGCYSPGPIRAAYDVPSSLDGAGQTIVIVDAFGSPTIQQDLKIFDETFGVPDPPSFTILCPDGCPTFAPNDTYHDQVGWSVETSLDVEWAHAIAPAANLVLVVAATSSGSAINTAEAKAISMFPGAVMSQSFGIPEFLVRGNNAQILQAEKNYALARAANITVLASAGDFGATNGTGATFANAGFPSSDPLNTAVGGTMGDPYPFGLVAGSGTAGPFSYGGEQVWNEGPPIVGESVATGGAPSLFFPVPAFQSGLGLTARATPDVSYNAAIDGGVLVAWSAIYPAGTFFIVGGTSAGSPQWAGIVALANQSAGRSLGYLNDALYSLRTNPTTYARDFHDITVGNNQLGGTSVGFPAGTGWDDATGLGTPDVAKLVPDLVAAASH